MELVLLFSNSFLVGFSGAMMPGPLLTVGIAETPRSGWRTGPIISIGHAIAEVVVVVLLSAGVVAISENGIITGVIGVAGGLALLLMGGMMAYDILTGRVKYEYTGNEARTRSSVLIGKGITASISNPYWFVWWGTTGLAFVVKSVKLGIAGPVVFYFGHILSDFVWYTVVSVVLWRGKKIFVGAGLKTLILMCAAFLLYLGGSFIIDGLGNLD
ncbi:MAG TPA: LysE family transporter [candidate division Zixibacteria bacterium]|nr:LysE family transporter [candidate division Zixibacteria bacterium]